MNFGFSFLNFGSKTLANASGYQDEASLRMRLV